MASAVVSSSSSRYPWKQQTLKTSFFCHQSNPFISLSFTHPPKPSNRFVYLFRTPANHTTPPKVLSASQPIKSPDINNFNLLFQSQSFCTPNKFRVIILLNVLTIVYASDIPVLKEVEEFMDPATFNVVRFSLSAVPFLPATLGARNDAHICKAGAEFGLWTRQISRTTRKENFIPLLGIEVCVVAVSSITWFLFEGWFGESHRPWTWELFWASWVSFPWIPAIYTGVFSGICLWVEMAAVQEVSATEGAIIYGLEPIWGAGFAWFLLGERWGIYGWIGAALVLGGSLIAQTFGSLHLLILEILSGEQESASS